MITFATIDHGYSGTPRSSSASPTVFVVADDVATRVSLGRMIRASGWQAEVFAAAPGFLAHPRVMAPSCLILDVGLPGLSGLELQKRLAVERPDLPLIVITAYGDVHMSVQAMKAGAAEFLLKPVGDEVLRSAIGSALERSRSALADGARTRAVRERYASLSRREREVMLLVVAGLLNKQVGGELGISEITVKAHRGQVMRKMKADSLPALVRMASSLGVAAFDG